jgi:hypothetical protein
MLFFLRDELDRILAAAAMAGGLFRTTIKSALTLPVYQLCKKIRPRTTCRASTILKRNQ